MEAITTKLQKNQGVVREKLKDVENRMCSMEENMTSVKETMVNVETMMRRMLQPSKEKSIESSNVSVAQVDIESTGIFAGK